MTTGNCAINQRSAAYFLAIVVATLTLSACGTLRIGVRDILQTQDSAPDTPVDVSNIPDAVPKVEPRSKYGNPKSYVVNGRRYHTLNSSKRFTQRGIASWYGKKFHGRRTSSGDRYDMYAMTAAHKTLPLPTYVEVENLRNGKRVIVRVNDRGPFYENRIIDLSYTAAQKLNIIGRGTGLVEIRTIDPRTWSARQSARAKPATGRGPTSSGRKLTIKLPEIYLQLGAFSVRGNADRLVAQTARHGIRGAIVVDGVKNGEAIYKVRIGPINSVEFSDVLVAQLLRAGLKEYITVIE